MVMLEIPRDCITKFMKSQVPVLEQKESDDIMIKAEEFDENEIKFDEDEIKMLEESEEEDHEDTDDSSSSQS